LKVVKYQNWSAMLSHLHQHSGASMGRLIAPREESLAGVRDDIVAGRSKTARIRRDASRKRQDKQRLQFL
jgi:hypothetical protein